MSMTTTSTTKTTKNGHQVRVTRERLTADGVVFVTMEVRGPGQESWVVMSERFDHES